jgi:hypothetical protein
LWLHRLIGQVYCLAVAAGWLASLPIAAHAQTGRLASAGFLVLGALWVGATARAYFLIRRRQIQRHREWMIRSYALTCAAITLRLYLPILSIAGFPIAASYPLVAWICWVPNLIFAELLVTPKSAPAPRDHTHASSAVSAHEECLAPKSSAETLRRR